LHLLQLRLVAVLAVIPVTAHLEVLEAAAQGLAGLHPEVLELPVKATTAVAVLEDSKRAVAAALLR
jgi:hypothetical protein